MRVVMFYQVERCFAMSRVEECVAIIIYMSIIE